MKRIIIQNHADYLFVNLDDIEYFESRLRQIIIKTAARNYEFYGNFKEFETSICLDNRFIKVHRSYIVNINKIIKIQDHIIMTEHGSIPVSKHHKQDFKIKYFHGGDHYGYIND